MFSMKKVLMATILIVGTVFASGSAMAIPYSVDITISDMEGFNLGAFDIDVSYDASLVTFDSYTLTTELGALDGYEAEDWSYGDGYNGYGDYVGAGTAHFAVMSYLASDSDVFSSQSDSFVLATLYFDAAATSDLEDIYLSYIDLSDENCEWIDCPVDVTNIRAVPEPSAILLMGTGLLGIAGIRRRSSN